MLTYNPSVKGRYFYKQGTYMSFETILINLDHGVATLVIKNPPLNVLSTQVGHEINKALDKIETDPAISVIVITGDGNKAFAAGADIRELQKLSGVEAEAMANIWDCLFTRIEEFRLPVIAAVNGMAVVGGCELAIACDIRYASENALFGQPAINLGIIPGWGGTQRLPRLVGKGRALELMMTGDTFDVKEAKQMGLINQIVSPQELMATVRNLARRLCNKGGLALTAIKTCVNQGLNQKMEEGLALESREFGVISSTEDKIEGIAAFLEKRPANFRKN